MDDEMDSNESCEELEKLAKAEHLPLQILECLIHTGFDTVSTVAALEDVKSVEKFLRDNSSLFEDNPKRRRIYGLHDSSPKDFTFLPGHLIRLTKFIEKCKSTLKKRSNTRSTICKTTPPKDEQNTCKDSNREFSKTPDKEKPAPSWSSKRILESAFAFKCIKERLERWIKTNMDPVVSSLRLGDHYEIEVEKANRRTYGRLEEPGTPRPLNAAVACRMCHSKVQLSAKKNLFVISNATRHFTKCVKKHLVTQEEGAPYDIIRIESEVDVDVIEVVSENEEDEPNEQVKEE